MNRSSEYRNPIYWAGVALGPAAWGVNTQTVYAITPFACGTKNTLTIIMAAVLAVVALAGSFISARAVGRNADAEWSEARGGGTRNFMAWIGVGAGVLFALVILDQLAASVMVSPCLR